MARNEKRPGCLTPRTAHATAPTAADPASNVPPRGRTGKRAPLSPRALRLRDERIAGLCGASTPRKGPGYVTRDEAIEIVDRVLAHLPLGEDPERALSRRAFFDGLDAGPGPTPEFDALLAAVGDGVRSSRRADWRRAHRDAAEQAAEFPPEARGEFSAESADALGRIEAEQAQIAADRRRRDERASRRPGRNDKAIAKIVAQIDAGSRLAAETGGVR